MTASSVPEPLSTTSLSKSLVSRPDPNVMVTFVPDRAVPDTGAAAFSCAQFETVVAEADCVKFHP